MIPTKIIEKNESSLLEMSTHRKGNKNNINNNNVLPSNVITIPMHLWTDPTFWQNENEQPGNYFMINGRKVPNYTTLNELGLVVSPNSVYSDPGEYNAISPLALPPLAAPLPLPSEKIHRSLAIPKKRKTAKKSKQANKPKSATRNNRFGFKKAFGALSKGLKKLTGRSRKNRH